MKDLLVRLTQNVADQMNLQKIPSEENVDSGLNKGFLFSMHI